ncbi:Thiol:disulfide interchange protein TlpA [Beijerinckiaceae bacterium RH AL1]|nr:Thiol:disulfide interchange protein TlpA [Beijerinckiaceae bacterium RH CH11]VVB50073.1 Thiol:disulfide interchange protein TlpA [Beijerinckiaceae bacterium RH AL8]VVC57183.1 Thiol:disulfide interchange protein TlpA [Beijerinckiaceae bacterium RH AL1]
MTEVTGKPERPRGRRTALVAGALALVAASGIGLYALMPHGGKATAHSGACARSLDLAQALDPLARGDVAALILASAPNDLGAIAFDDGDGGHKIVADFKGRSILLNLWATWCVPCRAEMPALDRLEGALGSKTFQVVPVDIDTARLDRPRAFLQEIGARHVKFFSDHSADILQTLHGTGLPTSVLIGPDGCEIGTMAGPALWDSPDAKALIERIAAPSNGA